MAIWGLLGGLVSGPLKDWHERRKIKLESQARIIEAKTKAEVARLEKLVDAEISWEAEMTRQAASSWKDEYWTIVLSIPMVCVFVPGLAPFIEEGFARLAMTPEWYRYALLLAIGAAFGVRLIDKARNGKHPPGK